MTNEQAKAKAQAQAQAQAAFEELEAATVVPSANDSWAQENETNEPEVEKTPWRVNWLDLSSAFAETPPALDMVIPGLLAGTVGALVSGGGVGKTMLTMQLMVTVTGGPDLLDMGTLDSKWRNKAGKVVFLTAEDPALVLTHRFHNIGHRLNIQDRAKVIENLKVAPLVGERANLMSSAWQARIINITKGARLVIIDTLRRFHELDENNGGEMSRLLAVLEKLCNANGTTVLFLHHTSKNGSLNGSDTQQASRGSSVLTDNIRFQCNLSGMSEKQAKESDVDESCRRNFVRLSFSKLNYSAPISDVWFRRGDGGVLEPAWLEKNVMATTKKQSSTHFHNNIKAPKKELPDVPDF